MHHKFSIAHCIQVNQHKKKTVKTTTDWMCCNGPEGCPNNLPQPAWRLVELFFWSDLSSSRADLCSNSYVISTRFSLLSTLPSCTRYISYEGILGIIHNVLFRIIHLYDNKLGPTDFRLTCYFSYFSIFE
jgi:hypothetical protein